MKHPVKVEMELERAKAGSELSADFICRYVWEQFGKRIWGLFSNDTADDRDDLKQIYWMAVARALSIVDERGDPLYHLGQRGFWAVGAHIRRKEAMQRLLSLDAPKFNAELGEDSEITIGDALHDPNPYSDVEGIVVNQLGSRQQVSMILNLELAPIAQRALDAIMSGQAGNPAEIGFNKNLAKQLGVSPQRASQAMQSLRSAVVEGGVTV